MFLKESQFYTATNRHFEEILKQVKLWLEPLDDRLFWQKDRQKILDAMKGQEPEKKLITLLPAGFSEKLMNKFPDDKKIEERIREKFQKEIERCIKGTQQEKTFRKEEMELLLVRKLLELTNPNSEYDVLFFQKVGKSWNRITDLFYSFSF